jgi:hypothetical protein
MKLKKIDFSNYWLKRKRLLNNFWKKWLTDYLEELRVYKKWTHPKKVDLSIGDIVLLKPESIQKNQWNLARVEKIHKKSNDEISKVEVRNSKGNLLLRTVRQVALLEPNLDKVTEKSQTTQLSQGDGNLHGEPLDSSPLVQDNEVPEETSAIKVTSVPGPNMCNPKTNTNNQGPGKRIRHKEGYYKNLTKKD